MPLGFSGTHFEFQSVLVDARVEGRGDISRLTAGGKQPRRLDRFREG